MKKYFPYFILVIGLIFVLCGDILIGFDGMFFGFTMSSSKMYQLVGLILFGVGTLFTLSSTIFLYFFKKKK